MWDKTYPLTNTLNFKVASSISLVFAVVTLAINILYEAISRITASQYLEVWANGAMPSEKLQ